MDTRPALPAALLCFLAATSALAQTPVTPSNPIAPTSPPSYELPSSAWYAPPPPLVAPAPPPGAYYHGGFYLRAGMGFAWSHAQFSGGLLPREVASSGFGRAANFSLGGAIAQKLMLAADLGWSGGPSATQTSFYHLLGLLDWYPNPRGGLHVQLGGGVSMVDFKLAKADAPPNAGDQGHGFAWHLGAGWEGFVSEQWSLGALLRLDGTSADVSRLDEPGGSQSVLVVAPSLLFVATYN